MFFDIHTHHKPAKEADVFSIYNLDVPKYICCCGLDLENVNYSLGIHPWHIREDILSENLRFIEENACFESVKAIGECGLDKLTETPWNLQLRAFNSQIAISEKFRKPMIIHCVKAYDELIALKKEYKPQQAWIIHGFRGKPEQMDQLIHQGFYLSFGIRYNEDTIRKIPLTKLFLETDDTGISIRQVYKKISGTLKLSPEKLIAQIAENIKIIVT